MTNKKPFKDLTIAIKGAGDLASGIACRLHAARLRRIYMLELARPLAVRRRVAFCEAIYDAEKTVEGVTAVRAAQVDEVRQAWRKGHIAVKVDPIWDTLGKLPPDVVIDAIIAKKNLGTHLADASLVIGLGPGFIAGKDVHRAIETQRGHNFGRVLRQGSPQNNTGIPGNIAGYTSERVLRAHVAGIFKAQRRLGESVKKGDTLAWVQDQKMISPIDGVIRGLIRDGAEVAAGLKIGDVDPRDRADYCDSISDKARSLGGAVLEAILGKFNV